GHRFLDDHLTQLPHDQEGDEAANGIAENHRRAGALHHARRTQEQAGADGAAQGDQLYMTVLQATREWSGVQRVVAHKNPWWRMTQRSVAERRALYTG